MDDELNVDFSSGPPPNEVGSADIAAAFYDYMEDPNLDPDCETIDEIGAFINFYVSSPKTKKALMNSNNSQIFVMLCCFAFDSVSTTKPSTNLQELFLLTNTAFINVWEHLFLREEFQKLVLNKFPNKTWPATFVTYLEELQDAAPTESWLNKNAKIYKTHDGATHRKLHFGCTVIATAKKAFREIRMHYNRFFIFLILCKVFKILHSMMCRRYKHPHELKSGINMSAMFKGIKLCLFKPNAQRLAVAAADKADLRAKALDKEVSAYDRRSAILERVTTDIRNYDPATFWPEYWLAFLVCSIPVNDFVITRKLGLISLCPIEKLDKDAKKVYNIALIILHCLITSLLIGWRRGSSF